ncbi:hypothetical protein DPMN_119405 [Dreissena polymorpha]|uniref:Transposase n=1 Tax=Dreissena polymorpha TaxID=45954 RepID=A0A9D4JPE2_DREPO|nr:hypothetical protein DPMN_119405 [Dreissena polymorpha]
MMCLWQYCLQFQLLLSLRYLAKGAFYSEVADTHGVSRSTVCRVIGRVVNSINANIDNIRQARQTFVSHGSFSSTIAEAWFTHTTLETRKTANTAVPTHSFESRTAWLTG